MQEAAARGNVHRGLVRVMRQIDPSVTAAGAFAALARPAGWRRGATAVKMLHWATPRLLRGHRRASLRAGVKLCASVDDSRYCAT